VSLPFQRFVKISYLVGNFFTGDNAAISLITKEGVSLVIGCCYEVVGNSKELVNIFWLLLCRSTISARSVATVAARLPQRAERIEQSKKMGKLPTLCLTDIRSDLSCVVLHIIWSISTRWFTTSEYLLLFQLVTF